MTVETKVLLYVGDDQHVLDSWETMNRACLSYDQYAPGCSISLAAIRGPNSIEYALDPKVFDWYMGQEPELGWKAIEALKKGEFIATFRPQAWVNDHCIDVEGGCQFNALANLTNYTQRALMEIEGADNHDSMANGLAARESHAGPFEVDIDLDALRIVFAAFTGVFELIDKTSTNNITEAEVATFGRNVKTLYPELFETASEPTEVVLFPVKEGNVVLDGVPDLDRDFVIEQPGNWAWITVGNVSVKVKHEEEGVVIDAFMLKGEMEPVLFTTAILFTDVDADLCEAKEVDYDDVAAWCEAQGYGALDAMPPKLRAKMIDEFSALPQAVAGS